VHGHLGGTVDLEGGIDLLDEPDRADVLHESRRRCRVDAVAQVEAAPRAAPAGFMRTLKVR
jgi:hypothetical protein